MEIKLYLYMITVYIIYKIKIYFKARIIDISWNSLVLLELSSISEVVITEDLYMI